MARLSLADLAVNSLVLTVGLLTVTTGIPAAKAQPSIPSITTPTLVKQIWRRAVPRPATSTQSADSIAATEQAIHTLVNQHRATQGLPPLTLDTRISQQARLHSQAMANGQVAFGHGGFEQRGRAIAAQIPYRSFAENVAYNQGYSNPSSQAVEGWLRSSGHRTNIQGQYETTGIGVAINARGEYYFTQLFLKRR